MARTDAPTPRGGCWVVFSADQDGSGREVDDRGEKPTLRYDEFVVAAAIRAAEAAGEYGSERARAAFAAAAETGASSGAQPSALACLRLAADGVPTAWERANARAWPLQWRETVRCLLLCRHSEADATGLGMLRDDHFDAIVARAARGGGVWPTVTCTLVFRTVLCPWDFWGRHPEHVSLFDLSFPTSKTPAYEYPR